MSLNWPEAKEYSDCLRKVMPAEFDDQQFVADATGRLLELFQSNHLWQALHHEVRCRTLDRGLAQRVKEGINRDEFFLALLEDTERLITLFVRDRTDEETQETEKPNSLAVERMGRAIELIDAAQKLEGAFDDKLSLSPVVMVPVALTQDSGAIVARLQLETVKGVGETHQHPGDAVSSVFNNSDFETAMKIAFEAARALAVEQDNSIAAECPDCHGRWRLIDTAIDTAGAPIASFGGKSAGAAAFYGWYCALTKSVSDPRVMVAAEINTEPEGGPITKIHFKEVGHIDAKTKAVGDYNSRQPLAKNFIDTIATVGANFTEVEGSLKGSSISGVRVVRLPEALPVSNNAARQG